MDALRAMEGQKNLGKPQNFYKSIVGEREFFFSKNGDQNANAIKVQPQGISVPSLDALRAMEGQKNSGKSQNFFKYIGGEGNFFQKMGTKMQTS